MPPRMCRVGALTLFQLMLPRGLFVRFVALLCCAPWSFEGVVTESALQDNQSLPCTSIRVAYSQISAFRFLISKKPCTYIGRSFHLLGVGNYLGLSGNRDASGFYSSITVALSNQTELSASLVPVRAV